MGRRIRSEFELDVFDQRVTAPKRLEEFLSVYVSHFAPRHRTDTNQLLHYLANPLPGRRIIYFGLSFEGRAAGFCSLMYYPQEAIGIFDFIVIAPTRRGHGAFFAFAELIAQYLEAKRILPNYLVAEILLEDGPLTHGITPVLMMRLLRFQRFRRAKLPYRAPDPMLATDPKSCAAVLMLAVEPDRPTIDASEFIRVVRLIYLDHYLAWFRGVMPPAELVRYEEAVHAECTRVCAAARAKEVIVLNGMKDLDIALEPSSERHQLTLVLLGGTTTAVTLALAFYQEPLITIPLALLAAATLALALLRHRFRRWLLRLSGRGG